MLGVYLKSLRQDKNWTLRKAQEQLGLSYGYIRGAENENFKPKLSQLKKFSAGYGVQIEELIKLSEGLVTPQKRKIEFDLSQILFIQLTYRSTPCLLEFHTSEDIILETLSLPEYMKYEKEIEEQGFIRTDNGVFVNMSQIKGISKDSLYVYFDTECKGKRASLTHLTYRWLKSELEHVLKLNNNLSTEIVAPVSKYGSNRMLWVNTTD
jgi:transcriptional regulator with XRE-family HTH domain